MPIREYKCKKCGNYMETIQGINEKTLEKCPECGGKLEKLISNSSFVLKGSGWYKTDYAAGNKTTESKAKKSKDESAPAAAAPSCACSCASKECGH